MLSEPTTLATFASLIGDTLNEDYGINPRPLFAEAEIDTRKLSQPGARISFAKMDALWMLAAAASEDRWFGLAAGARAEPAHFYVLGHAWLASETLLDASQRVMRYGKVLSTTLTNTVIREEGDRIAVVEEFPDPTLMPCRVAEEFGFAAFFRLCELMRRDHVRPLSVELVFPKDDAASKYDELFGCPISYGNEREVFYYSAREFGERLPGYIPDILDATSRIAKNYIESLDQSAVATEVRRLLVKMLPAGNVNQDSVAERLYRSRSTLQRQLSAEGTSYRDILEDTRKGLAEQYLRDGDYSQAEVAYIVGFSDQSNFARAFKRWTGMTPGDYQNAA